MKKFNIGTVFTAMVICLNVIHVFAQQNRGEVIKSDNMRSSSKSQASETVPGEKKTDIKGDCSKELEAQKALYKKFTEYYPKTSLDDRRIALETAKEFVRKYGQCSGEDIKPIIAYFNNYIPAVVKPDIDYLPSIYTRFDTAMRAQNYDEVYAVGKEIIEQKKPFVNMNGQTTDVAFDVIMVLASIGLDESIKGNKKYNADTIKYALTAIDWINAGRSSSKFGVICKTRNYSFISEKYPDARSNALGWLNYTIGYLKYYVDQSETSKKEAIAYFYKASQFNSVKKNDPIIYESIGAMYYAEFSRLETERLKKLEAANPGRKDEMLKKENGAIREIIALEKGYADRILDAYSRAYNLTGNNLKAKKDSIYKELSKIYGIRYQGKENDLNYLIINIESKPFPDPATPIVPVR